MPRWNSLQIVNTYIQRDNVLSVFDPYKGQLNFKNQQQTLPNDIRLNYDGDIDFNDSDLIFVYNLEAFVQRLYFYLITPRGTLPGFPNFGTNIEFFIGKMNNQIDLNALVRLMNSNLEEFEDIEYVNDITASLIRENQSYYIKINLDIKPRNFEYKLILDMQVF
jgi:hypothetical protein